MIFLNPNSNIVVTGAGGFIGERLVKQLCAIVPPEQIVCVLRTPTRKFDLESLGVKTVIADLAKSDLTSICKNASFVFHLAARVRYGMNSSAPDDFNIDNRDATVNLLRACSPNLRRFIHMSSVNAVERSYNDPCRFPIGEDSPCAPVTAYGKSKLASENAVRDWHLETGRDYLILRPPSIVYGPGCSLNSGMAKIIAGVNNKSLFMGINFPGLFSVIHVDDLARLTIEMAFHKNLQSKVYFLASEPPLSLREIASTVAADLKRPFRKIDLPNIVYDALNLVIRMLSMNQFLAKKMPIQLLMLLRNQCAVSSKRANQEGFAAKIPLSIGLKTTIPWVLSQSHGQ